MFKQTQYVQATSHSDQYTEFVIPKGALRDFRLIDFGVSTYVTAGGGQDRSYPFGSGSTCLIDRITLYNGADIVSQARGVGQIFTFLQLCSSGPSNYGLGSELYQNNLVYDLGANITIPTDNPKLNVDNSLTYIDLWKILPFFLGLDQESYKQMHKAVKEGNGKRMKEIAKQSNLIRADMMDLRLIIEYVQGMTADRLFVNGNAGDRWTIKRPILVCDKVVGVPMDKDFQVVFDTYDFEQIQFNGDPVADVDVPMQQLKLYGANDKYLKDITFINGGSGNTLRSQGFTQFGSTSQNKEIMNVIVNSEKLIPLELDSPARKQMFLNYSKPNFMCPILSNLYGHAGTQNNQLYGPNTSNAFKNLQQFSYVNLMVDKQVSQLSLQYSRRTFTGASQREPILMGCVYRTLRVLEYKNGRAQVTY